MLAQEGCRLRRNEEGLTAVIEFLAAFTLFMMILTAFYSMTQLEMGSNDPSLDRLDRSASLGLDRLLSGEGWFVPGNGTAADIANGTADWHRLDSEELYAGNVRAGLVSSGVFDFEKMAALSNITEHQFVSGLGLPAEYSVRLVVSVESSPDDGRVGEVLFEGGTSRIVAESSSLASRLVVGDGESLRVVLEVHDGGQHMPNLQITEVMARPMNGGPEWFEVYNPDSFATPLIGYSFHIDKTNVETSYLFKSGLVSGKSVSLFTGDPTTQVVGNATNVVDLGVQGLLGVGMVNGLPDGQGSLFMKYTPPSTSYPGVQQRIFWGGDTGLFMSPGDGIVWDGEGSNSTSWSVTSTPSPGDWSA